MQEKEFKMLYNCKLIKSDIIIENFFRQGESEEDVRTSLEYFRWPDGEWRITDTNNWDD